MKAHLATSNILINAGFQAFAVGGAVRDQFMRLNDQSVETHDYDLATNATPAQILSVFPEGKQVGADFPVVLVGDIEIASFRTEHAFGRKDVQWEIAKTIDDDLARRDFTINAIAMNMQTKKIVDPYDGIKDVSRRVIRFVGDPNQRISEDPVRMLRAVRFAARFGYTIEQTHVIKANADMLQFISPERRMMELEKIINGASAGYAIRLLADYGLLKWILPSLASCIGVDQNKHHDETVFDHCIFAFSSLRKASFELKLAVLMHDVGKPPTKRGNGPDCTFYGHDAVGARLVRRDLEALKFPSKTIDTVEWIVKEHMFFFTEDTKPSRVKVRMAQAEKMGITIRDLLRMRIADRRGNKAKSNFTPITASFKRTVKMIRMIEKNNEAKTIGDLAINGSHLIEIGMKPGPQFKTVLNLMLNNVMEGTLPNELESQKRFAMWFMHQPCPYCGK